MGRLEQLWYNLSQDSHERAIVPSAGVYTG